MSEMTEDTMLANLSFYRYSTEYSPLPMVAMEGMTHVVRYANPAFCRLYALDIEELYGRTFTEIMPDTEVEHCLKMLDDVSLYHKASKAIEHKHVSPKDEVLNWTYLAWPVFDMNNDFSGVMLLVTDTTEAIRSRMLATEINKALLITEVRQQIATEAAEERAKILRHAMRETDHRVKNHLQILGALLEMQAVETSDPALVSALNQIRIHVRTLASIHGMLSNDTAESAGGTMRIMSVLEEVVSLWQQLIGVENIRWDVVDIRLPVKPCISLATIVNELINNAIKHGGRTVTLNVTSSGDTATLQVYDDGPGFNMPFDAVANAHMGLDLVETVCRTDLKGQTMYINRPEGGACVRLTFPMPSNSSEDES